MHAKTSCLRSSPGNYWGKRTSSSLFDVTMGSFDGAESCELVGYYILSKQSMETTSDYIEMTG